MFENRTSRLGTCAIAILCLGTMTLASPDRASAQDEQPIRLEKKNKPADKSPVAQPTPPADKAKSDKAKSDKARPKPETRPEGAPLDPEELEKQVQETINRLSKNLHTAEDHLNKKDPGNTTQQVQKDIIKDLDELIEQTRQQEEQMQQDDQQNQQQQNQSKSGQSRRQRMMQAQRNRSRQQRNQMAQLQRNRNQGQQRQPGQQQQSQEENAGTGDNPPDQGNGVKKDYALKTAEMYKDIWGHLPEALRQEMSQYTREQFMAKYNDLLKQYYATIAEKGRKQSDR